jgi:hypothetical protein
MDQITQKPEGMGKGDNIHAEELVWICSSKLSGHVYGPVCLEGGGRDIDKLPASLCIQHPLGIALLPLPSFGGLQFRRTECWKIAGISPLACPEAFVSILPPPGFFCFAILTCCTCFSSIESLLPECARLADDANKHAAICTAFSDLTQCAFLCTGIYLCDICSSAEVLRWPPFVRPLLLRSGCLPPSVFRYRFHQGQPVRSYVSTIPHPMRRIRITRTRMEVT